MKAKAKKNILAKLTNYKPKWLDHLRRSAVLDGDAVFLHQQSQDMLSGAQPRLQKRNFILLEFKLPVQIQLQACMPMTTVALCTVELASDRP